MTAEPCLLIHFCDWFLNQIFSLGSLIKLDFRTEEEETLSRIKIEFPRFRRLLLRFYRNLWWGSCSRWKEGTTHLLTDWPQWFSVCAPTPWTVAERRPRRSEQSSSRRSICSECRSLCSRLERKWRRGFSENEGGKSNSPVFRAVKSDALCICFGSTVLTAFNFDVAQLPVHGEVLEIHRAGRGNGQSEIMYDAWIWSLVSWLFS